MPRECGYTWAEFQQLLTNIFGEQTEPPDVPRSYIRDALIEINLFEKEDDCLEEQTKQLARQNDPDESYTRVK